MGSCTLGTVLPSSSTAARTTSASGQPPGLTCTKSAAATAATAAAAAAAGLAACGRWRLAPRSRHGNPGSCLVLSFTAAPHAVRQRAFSRLSWTAATVAATFSATARFGTWLASSTAGRSLANEASLARSSASPLPRCQPSGMASFTASFAVRWLGIQLQCTSGLARRAAANKLQHWCPASPAACLPSRMLYHIRCTDWQSVMTVPPSSQKSTGCRRGFACTDRLTWLEPPKDCLPQPGNLGDDRPSDDPDGRVLWVAAGAIHEDLRSLPRRLSPVGLALPCLPSFKGWFRIQGRGSGLPHLHSGSPLAARPGNGGTARRRAPPFLPPGQTGRCRRAAASVW